MMYFVGIDWADEHHDIVIADQNGNYTKEFRIQHNRMGMETLKEKLLKFSPNPEELACIIETRNGLLVQFLLDSGFPVYPLNPKLVNNRRKPSGAKSDPIDARLLSDIGRADLHKLHRLTPDSELLQELKILTRDQDILIEESTRLTNRLIACLKEYYPAALDFFSSPSSPVARKLLKRYPTIETLKLVTVPELAEFLKINKCPSPNQTAIKIWNKVQAPQLEAAPATVNAKSRLMLAIIAQLEPLTIEIEKYDKEISRLFQLHSDSKIFSSLPGAGVRLAPRLLAEWGDNCDRYENFAVVQALAGTSPVIHQSGKYQFAKRRRSCVKPFRRAMYLFAFQTISKVPWARKYYDLKRSQGKTNSEALRALANIWVKIIFSIWLNHTIYDESVYLAAQTKHARVA